MKPVITKEEVVKVALSCLGSPAIIYKNSQTGLTPEGFDCSGFITYVLTECGLAVPKIRHVNRYFDAYGVFVHEENRQAGDLVFFSGTGIFPNHMGMMIDRDTCIHAAGRRSPVVMLEPYVEISPAIIPQVSHYKYPDAASLYSRNPIGFKRPTIQTDVGNTRYQLPIT
jgi:cell wall-associated NlpC family hydrolase